MPVSLDLLKTHWSSKRLLRYRNEFLSDLIADHAHTRPECLSDKILGDLGLFGSLQVKGIDKNVRVEKVLSGAHSFLPA